MLPMLLAGGAGYMAYYSIIPETKRDKKLEEQKKDNLRLDKLLYGKLLIDECL